MYLFLISSNIICGSTCFTMQERLNQTLETIQSIKTRVPNVKLLICEGSSYVWDESTDYDVFYANNQTIHNKSLGEAYVLGKTLDSDFFKSLTSDPTLVQIFKISGRYTLNNDFDLQKFNGKINALFYPSRCIPNRQVAVTVLYSFRPDMIDEMRVQYSKVQSEFVHDIEHTIFQGIEKNKVSPLGVQGLVSYCGSFWAM